VRLGFKLYAVAVRQCIPARRFAPVKKIVRIALCVGSDKTESARGIYVFDVTKHAESFLEKKRNAAVCFAPQP
jgi:hypothetical protein